jgi:pimeloyl-ACP methyl ester carboxylesterase
MTTAIQRRAVTIPGARLVAEWQGTGDNLVLVHGFAGDRRTWNGIWTDLSRRRRVTRYDLRGFGESTDLHVESFRHSADLEALLDALSIESCDLLGVSMGGSIALNFALDHPGRVRRLVLASPGIVAWQWSEDWQHRWQSVTDKARAGDVAGARDLWWNHPLFAVTRTLPRAAAELGESIDSYSGAHWAERDREMPVMPDVDRLYLLNPPMLLLTGSADMPDYRLIADLIQGAVPKVRRIDYEGAGHMLHLERPETFVADVMSFLNCR